MNLSAICLNAHGVKLALAADRGELSADRDILFELEQSYESWWGEDKSFDAMHWALTGRSSSEPDWRLFGAESMRGQGIGEWTALLEPSQVITLEAQLREVREDAMYERLSCIPAGTYGGDYYSDAAEHAAVVADAQRFVKLLKNCAADGGWLLLSVG